MLKDSYEQTNTVLIPMELMLECKETDNKQMIHILLGGIKYHEETF